MILTANYSPWSAYAGGGQIATHNIASSLAELGYDVDVVYTRAPFERIPVPPALPYRAHWGLLPALRSRGHNVLRPLAPLSVRRVVRRLITARPTIVHGTADEAGDLPRLRRAFSNVRFVMSPRIASYPPMMENSDWRRWPRFIWLCARRPKFIHIGRALQNADVCCPESGDAALKVQAVYGVSPEKVEVVNNGVTPAFFAASRDADAVEGPIVFFGRLTKDKGVNVLTEALGQLGKAAPPCEFIGRGPEAARIRQRARELNIADRVTLRDWLAPEALATRLAQARMAVLPSYHESFGIAMAEAMATGCPVITTNAGSLPEVVADQQTGLLVPPGDANALAEAISTLMRDPALGRALGEAGRRRAHDRFTWTNAARQYAAIYARLFQAPTRE